MIYIEIDFDYDDDFIDLFLEACRNKYTLVNGGELTRKDIIKICEETVETGKFQNETRLGFLKIYDGLTLVGMSIPREIRHEEHKVWNLDPTKVYYRMGMIYLDENYRGNGYAKQAASEFKNIYENVLWTVHEDNIASKKVAEFIGLKHHTTLFINDNSQWRHEPWKEATHTLEVWSN